MSNSKFFSRLSSLFNKARILFKQKRLWSKLRKHLYSSSRALGLQRDLSKDFTNPDAELNITIRPLKEGDKEILMDHGKLEKNHPQLANYQRRLIESELSTCYVAVTESDEPCYMQFLIGAKHNRLIKERFGPLFPKLDKDEALIEAAYMRPSFRGKHIMPAAMGRIAQKAQELGARWVITFVHTENIPSLKGCKRAGFFPYILREERWFLFRQYVSFHEIPPEIRAKYYRTTASPKKPPMAAQGNKKLDESKPALGTGPAS